MTGSNIPLSSICNPSSPSSAKAKHKQHSSEPASEYEKWVARLYNTPFFHPINNGLMNISILYDLMGSPLDDVSFVNYFLQNFVLQLD